MKSVPGLRARAGMTLIEVLLALTILAGSLTGLLAAASRCLAIMRRARIYQEAQYVLGAGEVDFPIRDAETFDDLVVTGERYGEDFVFSREVETLAEDDALCILRTQVTWTRGTVRGLEEVVQYIVTPEDERDPGGRE